MYRKSTGNAALTALSLASGLCVGISAAGASPSAAGKTDRSLSQTIASHPTSGWSSVIVRYAGDLTAAQEAQIKSLGGYVYRHLSIVHSVAVRIPSRNLNRLAALPFVEHLSADSGVKKYDEFTVESSGAAVAFQQSHLTGSNVTVAVVDSGIHNMADFSNPVIPGLPTPIGGSNRLLAQVNFAADSTGKVNAGSVDDKCGHGTHVAGIIAGNGSNSFSAACYRTFLGIAPQANLVNVRVLDANGQSTVSTVIAGLQWVVANRARYNIRVVNLSLGHPVGESYRTDPLCQAVEQAWKAGIVVVCAAGNEGRLQNTPDPSLDNEGYGTAYGSIQSPGNDPYVITVGAMKATDMVFNADGSWTHNRANDRIATYSSRGPSRVDWVMKPDIVAPGNKIISVDANNSTLDNYAGNTNDIRRYEYQRAGSSDWSNTYYRLSGTSMAAPVVSGAVALLLQSNSNLTPDTIKARLMISADKWTNAQGSNDPCTYGAGYLNIPAALNSTVAATQPALSPSLSEDDLGNVYINIDPAIWGNRAIWGTGINDLRAIWGTRAIWGKSFNILDASRAIWGKSVWSDRAIWGTNSSAVDLTSIAIQGE